MKGIPPFLRVLVRPRIKGKVAVANLNNPIYRIRKHPAPTVLPFTSTLKEHDREFPLRSLALKVTTWVPSENLCDVSVGKISTGVTSISGTSPSLSSAVTADQ